MPYNDYRQNFRDRDNFRRNGRQRMDERVNEKEVPESRHAVFFRGFGPDISSEKIKDHFQDEIGPCIIDFYKNTPERTFVAVRFDSKDDAAKCMDKYKDGKLWGYELEVTWYRDIRRYVAHVKGGRNERHDAPRRRDGRRSRSRRGSRDGSDSEDESRRKRKRRDSSSSSSSSGSSAHSRRSSRPESRSQHSKPGSAAHSPAKKPESKRVDDSMDISGISDNEEKDSALDRAVRVAQEISITRPDYPDVFLPNALTSLLKKKGIYKSNDGFSNVSNFSGDRKRINLSGDHDEYNGSNESSLYNPYDALSCDGDSDGNMAGSTCPPEFYQSELANQEDPDLGYQGERERAGGSGISNDASGLSNDKSGSGSHLEGVDEELQVLFQKISQKSPAAIKVKMEPEDDETMNANIPSSTGSETPSSATATKTGKCTVKIIRKTEEEMRSARRKRDNRRDRTEKGGPQRRFEQPEREQRLDPFLPQNQSSDLSCSRYPSFSQSAPINPRSTDSFPRHDNGEGVRGQEWSENTFKRPADPRLKRREVEKGQVQRTDVRSNINTTNIPTDPRLRRGMEPQRSSNMPGEAESGQLKPLERQVPTDPRLRRREEQKMGAGNVGRQDGVGFAHSFPVSPMMENSRKDPRSQSQGPRYQSIPISDGSSRNLSSKGIEVNKGFEGEDRNARMNQFDVKEKENERQNWQEEPIWSRRYYKEQSNVRTEDLWKYQKNLGPVPQGEYKKLEKLPERNEFREEADPGLLGRPRSSSRNRIAERYENFHPTSTPRNQSLSRRHREFGTSNSYDNDPRRRGYQGLYGRDPVIHSGRYSAFHSSEGQGQNQRYYNGTRDPSNSRRNPPEYEEMGKRMTQREDDEIVQRYEKSNEKYWTGINYRSLAPPHTRQIKQEEDGEVYYDVDTGYRNVEEGRPESRRSFYEENEGYNSEGGKRWGSRYEDDFEIERKPDLNKETRPEPDHRSIRQIAVERCPSIVDEKPAVDTMFNIRSQIIRELRHEPGRKSSSNGLQLSNLATKPEEIIRNKLAKFPEEFKSSVETKRKELEAVYRKDCQTFGLVAKKLVDKNADLEKSLKLALLGVLSDLEKETNETLLKYVEELELLFDA
ncbi:unnamed protein product [Bursaphelenchus xylophilus]|uniref:(pine wood nematode) hypothetical protein n=1 Tax=Bursaphelenchus xylophilus TaxID=6326 RepID=A0A1I7RKH6_BURXY|nr:unnamed protein product [Bursaphelenchus xylophilus]CAG9131318.1 unnamed protein product [Bursaphelenchus xylophilus]